MLKLLKMGTKEKVHIKMLVQSSNEFATVFSQRLEDECNEIISKNHLFSGLTVSLTSDSNGRQTATIQYITLLFEQSEGAAFDGALLKLSYE